MTDTPPVTLILPIRNEENSIAATLDSILAQDYNGEMEIIIADGQSTDRTREIITAYQARHANLRLVENPGRIVPTGFNLAVQAARGEVILRVDGHTTLAPDYVRQCLAALQRSGADNVGGRMDAHGETGFGRVVAAATSSPFGVGGARFHYSDAEEWVDTVYMGAWPRRVFEQIGLFDEELVRDQDDEFNYRLRGQGGRILLSPAIRSTYTNRSTPPALWRQYYQYGFYKVRVLQKHPRQMSLRQFVPPLFVLALVVSAALGLFWNWGGWLLVAIALAYLGANQVASLVTAARRGWGLLPGLPAAFAILHLAYGSGFLSGLFHFWNRWNDRLGKARFITKSDNQF